MGDFNYTLNEDEKKGGRRGSTLETNHLKDLMFEFRAINLGYSGSKFTWAKGNWDNTAIKRRLDKGIANNSWRLAYLKAGISHLGAIKSNHTLILLDTNPNEEFAHRPFKFKVAWLRDDSCVPMIENAWNTEASGSKFINLYNKQASTTATLRK